MSYEKKYEMTDETIDIGGTPLYRIRALRDFRDIRAGDLGGFIEGEHNLNHNGDSWIGGNARVCSGAYVTDNARVTGRAFVAGRTKICGNAEVRGNAMVVDSAEIYGNAKVSGSAFVRDYAQVFDNAEVSDHVILFDYAQVFDNARVGGSVRILGHVKVFEDAGISGAIKLWGNEKIRGNAEIVSVESFLSITGIGFMGNSVTFFRCEDGKIRVSHDNFCTELDEFVEIASKDSSYTASNKIYCIAAELARARIR